MTPEEAFSYLLQRACDELQTMQEQGVASFNQANFTQAGQAAERAEEIKELVSSLEKVRDTWMTLMPPIPVQPEILPKQPPEPRKHYQRTPPGERTPQKEFRIPILQVLKEMGGKGKTGAILDRVGELMDEVLNDTDRELLPSRYDIRWRNAAQWERLEMVKEGLLSSDSPSGTWEITSEGRRYLKDRI